MALKVRYARRARTFVAAEQAYLAERSPSAAQRFRMQLADAERRIADYPEIGSAARIVGTRRLVSAPYVLTYRVRGAEVEIASIRHGRQRDPDEVGPDAIEEIDEC